MLQDGWPDASDFPYPALIRIRYAHELDLEVLSIVQAAAFRTLAPELATQVGTTITSVAARVATEGASKPVPIEESASRANFLAFRSALSDEDLCPWPWPWKWPGPPPPPWRQGPNPQPWRGADPSPLPWRDVSLVAGARVLVSARVALDAMIDRSAAERVEAALTDALDLLAG